jgi:hypothetical protein
MALAVGRPEEWRDFVRRHQRFLQEVVPPLMRAANQVFVRTIESEHLHERVAFLLGRHVPEDFQEILVLCGNGYGIGALKLLRGLYERVVTMTYLLQHPEKAQDFVDWHLIEKQRLVSHLRLDGEDPARYLEPSELEAVDAEAERVKGRFPKGQRSWSGLDLRSMARAVGLDGCYTIFYYWPTLMVHPTIVEMSARVQKTADGVSFDARPQRDYADQALMGAHCCLLLALEAQIKHFRLAIDLAPRKADYKQYWERPPS